MTDRAQDTEAIRAALHKATYGPNPGAEGFGIGIREHEKAEAALARLVARLEAAERERDEATERLAKVLVGTERPPEAVFDQFRELYGLPTYVDIQSRLEAAERDREGMEHQRDFWEQRYETQHRTVHRMEDEIASLRAALAAAAPGETAQTP